MPNEELRKEAPRYRSVDALSGKRMTDEQLSEITACLASGGHQWDEAPSESYRCTRCPMVGALNWPTINESN